jgi:hypothetical protein
VRHPDQKTTQPTLATSDDIPRAVEFLILFFLRWTCFGFGGLLGLLTLTAWLRAWAWWVVVPLSILACVTIGCGVLMQPQGKFQFDRVGPSIIVPASRSPVRSDGTSKVENPGE